MMIFAVSLYILFENEGERGEETYNNLVFPGKVLFRHKFYDFMGFYFDFTFENNEFEECCYLLYWTDRKLDFRNSLCVI